MLYNNERDNSPLRTYSPKRGAETYDRPSYNVTQVKAATAYTSAVAATSSSCAAAPTEKERMIAQLMKEAAELRTRERDYKSLQDQLMNLEQNFGRLNEDKRRMDEDYKSRVDANIRFIQTLRSEVDE